MATTANRTAKKPPFPIVPVALGVGVLAGLYLLARRSNPQLEAARRHEAAIDAALGGGGRTPAGPIDLSKLTYGRLFVVGSEENPNDPFAGQYTVLTYDGVQNGTIRAKPLNAGRATTVQELNAQERDVPISRITAIRGT